MENPEPSHHVEPGSGGAAVEDGDRSHPAHGAESETRDDRVSRHTLANGLKLVIDPDSALPLVAMNLSFRAGSRNEVQGKTGLAHLFEHLLFQGSQHVPAGEHLHHVQRVGGRANGSTWYDRTTFFSTLPSDHLELGLWLESDRMGYLLPALTEERFETQRRVVINERRTRFDNRPYGRAYEHLHELLFPPGHPYRSPVIGHEADLEGLILHDAESFFRRFYAPSNAVLTIVGDIRPERAAEMVARYFEEIPGGTLPSRYLPAAPRARAGGRRIVRDSVELPRIYLGFRLPPYPTPPWYAADLVSAALTRGRSSLLYRDLVLDRQIAHDVNSFVLPTELESVFVLVATCKPDEDPETVETVVVDHLQELSHRPLEPRHYLRSRNRALTEYCRRLQSHERRADARSQTMLQLDDPDFMRSEVEIYLSTEPEDLTRLVSQHLRPEAAATVVYPARNGGGRG